MEHVDNIITQIVSNFDFAFMLSVNLMTYYIIRAIIKVRDGKCIGTWGKRIILMICTVIIGITYFLTGYDDNIVLVNSAIGAPVFWDWVLKPIAVKLGISYKPLDDCTK